MYIIIIISLLGCLNNTSKSDKYLEMEYNTSSIKEFNSSTTIILDSFLIKYPNYKNIIEELKSFGEEVSPLINSILDDSCFQDYRNAKDVKLSNYIPLSYKKYISYSGFKKKLNELSAISQNYIRSDSNLFLIMCYTFEDEFIFFVETFYFMDSFQVIDDLYRGLELRNYVHYGLHSVLSLSDDNSDELLHYFSKISNNYNTNYIGFYEDKYRMDIRIPIIHNSIYICDIEFCFLK